MVTMHRPVCSASRSSAEWSGGRAWLVCLSAALFFFYEFVQMDMFNAISQELMGDFSINAGQLGFLSAAYFCGNVIFLLFAGILVDRVSIRSILLGATVMVILALLLFAISHSWSLTMISRFLIGIGNAFSLISCIKLATRWFPSQRLAYVVGIVVTIALMGGVVAQTPLVLLAQFLGWRGAVLVDAGLGVVIAMLLYLFVQDAPAHQFDSPSSDKRHAEDAGLSIRAPETRAVYSSSQEAHLNPEARGAHGVLPVAAREGTPFSVREALSLTLRNKQNILGGLYTCLLNLPIILLGALWGVMYLTQAHCLTKTQASLVTSMIFIGTMIGSPSVGWISDYMGRRRLPMIAGAVLSLFTSLVLLFLQDLGFVVLLTLFLLLGIFSSTQIITYPLVAESNPSQLTGTSTSLASMLIMGGGAVFQPLFGFLIDLHRDQILQQGASLSSPGRYFYGLAIFPIAFIVSIVAACCLRETYGKPYC